MNSQKDHSILLCVYIPTLESSMLCPPLEVNPPIASHLLTSPLQGSTWGRVQDESPRAHLYVVPGISTPWPGWVEETKGTKRKMARSPQCDEARFGQAAFQP